MKLFYKFLFTILAIVVIGISLSAGFLYRSIQGMLESQISDRRLAAAAQAASRIDQYLDERNTNLQSLATQAALIRAAAGNRVDLAAAPTTLQQLQAAAAGWTTLQLLDTVGIVRASTAPNETGQAPYAPLRQQVVSQAAAGHTVSTDLPNTAGQAGRLVVVTPLHDGAKIVGLLAGQIDTTSLTAIMATFADVDTYLVNSAGAIIADSHTTIAPSPARSAQIQQILRTTPPASGFISDPQVAGDQVLLVSSGEPGFGSYRGQDWKVVMAAPVAAAISTARQVTLGLCAILLSLIILGITAMLWILNHKVLGPIRSLSDAVGRVTLGDLSHSVNVTSSDEVGQLGHNFNDMIRQLATTHRSLHDTSAAAEERRAQLESSINGLRQGFILTDTRGRVVLSNAAAVDFMRIPGLKPSKNRRSVSLATLGAMFPPDLHLINHVAMSIKNRQRFRFPAQPIGGSYVNLYLSPVVNKDNEAIGCAVLLEDVTEERIIQRSRDEFFSIASHELRTPLTAIRGNTALIKQYFPEILKDDSVNEMINDIHDSSIRLIDIVNDFLDASRLEQDKMKFVMQPFAIESLIEKVIYEMSGLSRDKGVALKFDQTTLGQVPPVYGDLNRVKQIIYNLIGNAMKFTKQGSVTINCLIQARRLKVTVSDTGPGIDAAGQQLLFHKFQQTAQSIITRDDTRGTGLGLYISKLLVEHMGGEIRLEHSEVGKGSTFSFTLPFASPAQIKAGAPDDTGNSFVGPAELSDPANKPVGPGPSAAASAPATSTTKSSAKPVKVKPINVKPTKTPTKTNKPTRKTADS